MFLRSGAILPTQADLPTSSAAAPDALTLTVWPGTGASGGFDLYDDEGQGFGYRSGAYRFTPLRSRSTADCAQLTIAAAQGRYPGALTRRAWTIRFAGIAPPEAVRLNGRVLDTGEWQYDALQKILSVPVAATPVGNALTITAGASTCGA